MFIACRVRAVHNWLVYGGKFDWIMGHNCYRTIDGNFQCNWCSFRVDKEQVSNIEDSQ